jgi:hypothetical protein
MKKWLVLIALTVLFSGCSSSVQDNINDGDETQEVVVKGNKQMSDSSYKIIKQAVIPKEYIEYMDGKKETLIYHSDDASEVEKFKIEYEKLTGESAPDIDGSIVIAKMGSKSTGGYSLELLSVEEDVRYTNVTIAYNSPKKGSLVTTAYTNPYIIIYLPNNHKDIKIIEK